LAKFRKIWHFFWSEKCHFLSTCDLHFLTKKLT
jgi:hypothetical protein